MVMACPDIFRTNSFLSPMTDGDQLTKIMAFRLADPKFQFYYDRATSLFGNPISTSTLTR